MNTTNLSWLILFFLCTSLWAAPDSVSTGKKRPEPVKHAPPVLEAGPSAPDTQRAAKTVHYGEKDVIQLNTKVRLTTMIVLPRNEQILDFVCGDKEFWVINGAQNFAYVKPAKTATQTNLNLVTASGNIYSFVLNEISEAPDAEPDLKVFVEPKEQSMIGAIKQSPRFVSAQDVEELQHRLDTMKEENRRQKRATEEAIDAGIQKFVASLRFPYRYQAGKKPFSVQAIYHSEKFTYIAAHPSETPTLYEVRDGQPNLIHFEFQNGIYVVQKILDKGYLAIGKHKLEFSKEE